MNLGCVVLPCPSTIVLTVADGGMENEMKMFLPHMCAFCIKVCAVGFTVLPINIDKSSFIQEDSNTEV